MSANSTIFLIYFTLPSMGELRRELVDRNSTEYFHPANYKVYYSKVVKYNSRVDLTKI